MFSLSVRLFVCLFLAGLPKNQSKYRFSQTSTERWHMSVPTEEPVRYWR